MMNSVRAWLHFNIFHRCDQDESIEATDKIAEAAEMASYLAMEPSSNERESLLPWIYKYEPELLTMPGEVSLEHMLNKVDLAWERCGRKVFASESTAFFEGRPIHEI